MSRLSILVGVVAAILVAPGEAASDQWAFRTPGGAAYCNFTSQSYGFICMTPRDGFWIQLRTTDRGRSASVVKGFNDAYVGYRNTAVKILSLGRQWESSDASVFTCWSRKGGLTCKHYEGLGFWLGRTRGRRIFVDAPGFKPNVRPFFRTNHGIWCGLNLETLVPENPPIGCWRPTDGLSLSVLHDGDVTYYRHEQSRGYRPTGFPLLEYGDSFSWRCKRVSLTTAEQCSARSGTAVFVCRSGRERLTCTNQRGHGFWVNARSFYPF